MWFKVDDGFTSSKSVLKIPRRYRTAAIGLWTLAGAWSAHQELDGIVPNYMLDELASTPAMAHQLVLAGLWEVYEGPSTGATQFLNGSSAVSTISGWRFRNWDRYNPTRAQIEEKRENERIRKAVYRESQRSPNGTPTGQTTGHHRVSEHPDPTRPDPTPKQQAPPVVGAKRAHQLPDDWQPNDNHTTLVAELGLNGPAELAHFRDWHLAKGSTMKDWNRAFNTWLRRSKTFTRNNTPRNGVDWEAALARAEAADAQDAQQALEAGTRNHT